MKKFLGIFVVVFIISCSKNPVPKPDNLLDDEVMTNILFDIAILQAADGTMTYRLAENNIKVNSFIYEKYKIVQQLIKIKSTTMQILENTKKCIKKF